LITPNIWWRERIMRFIVYKHVIHNNLQKPISQN
jgi:hypothetical protein